MIKVFYGDNRIKAQFEIKQVLGENYEVIDGETVTPEEMPSIFWGSSLFTAKRKILIRDLSLNEDVWPLLPQYLKTEHQIIIWEHKLDSRTKVYKELQNAKVLKKFDNAPAPERATPFDIMNIAMRDGQKAVQILAKIERDQDPYRFMGGLASQAIRNYSRQPNARNKRILKELSQLDMQIKTTKFSSQPWSLIEAFLLRLQDI